MKNAEKPRVRGEVWFGFRAWRTEGEGGRGAGKGIGPWEPEALAAVSGQDEFEEIRLGPSSPSKATAVRQ
jgi:hypothetical protein